MPAFSSEVAASSVVIPRRKGTMKTMTSRTRYDGYVASTTDWWTGGAEKGRWSADRTRKVQDRCLSQNQVGVARERLCPTLK